MSHIVAATEQHKAAQGIRLDLMIGAYSRIARQTGTTRSHVRRVVRGERSSPRIEAAFAKEMDRIEREVRKLERKAQRVAA